MGLTIWAACRIGWERGWQGSEKSVTGRDAIVRLSLKGKSEFDDFPGMCNILSTKQVPFRDDWSKLKAKDAIVF
ncbi:hypothetical protein TNCV_3035781 [Trichonephila clavipes]|nr:hypothetical protein TNCV_3035781 [Trichonephila clavipes]